MFEYESEDLKSIFDGVDPGNTAITQQMNIFEPSEKVMNYGKFPSRLIYYSISE